MDFPNVGVLQDPTLEIKYFLLIIYIVQILKTFLRDDETSVGVLRDLILEIKYFLLILCKYSGSCQLSDPCFLLLTLSLL